MYESYVSLKQQRRKQEAEEVLREFVASFQPGDETKKWVRDYLMGREEGQKMGHSLPSSQRVN